MHALKALKSRKKLKILEKKIRKMLKESPDAALDIQAYAMMHKGDFKAIGDYTLNRLGINLDKEIDNNDKSL
jgi:hypothetical protein